MSFLQDLRFGLRLLLKRPGFTLVTVLTLALGIGANTAIFSVMHGALLSVVPFEDPDELIFLGEYSEQIPTMSVSYPNFLDWRERNRSFEAIAAHRYQSYNLTGTDRPERLLAVHASATLLPLLRVEPVLGRHFSAAEDVPDSERVVMLSHRFWQRRFGGEVSVIGRVLDLDGEPYEVIGVTPPNFVYPLFNDRVEVYLPIGHFARVWSERRGSHPGIYVTARLLPGVTPAEAQADMERIAAELAVEYPDTNTNHGIAFATLSERMVRNIKPALLVLGAAVFLVLMIACVNVANLLLARGTGRTQEMAVRSALGAGRWQVVRQLLAESVLLGLVGGLLGLAVAHLGLQGLLSTLDRDTMPVIGEIGLHGDVLLFNLGVSIAVGLLFGLIPALSTARRDLLAPLKDGTKASAGRGQQRLRSALVIAEVGLALVVLAGALLFMQSFERLTSTSPGIDPENVLTVVLDLSTAVYPEAVQQGDFFDRLLERLEALPGVRSAATTMPLLGGYQTSVSAEGQEPPPPGESVSTDITRVSPGYFETLGLTLLQGRTFTAADREDAPLVAIVDQTFGERFWPGENPVGKRLKLDGDPTSDDPWIEVVGVVNHVKNYGVDQDSRIELYLPSRQSQFPFATVLLKTTGDPLALSKQVASAVSALDSDQPIAQIRSLESILDGSRTPQRLAATLLGVFALLAVVLAAIGIYGVMAWSVGQRRHEIGIRMAMGADRGDVLGMVVGQGLKLALVGVAIGLAVAFLTAPLIASQLYQIEPRDPRTLLFLPLLLIAVALAACALPARRASEVEPVVALRYE